MNSEEINYFAKTNFRNKEVIFGIKEDDRRRHFYSIGKTGMGKTNMIQNMAIQDIRRGKGVGIIDPHGEFAQDCLRSVPRERIQDVIYFNPADLNYPISMNVLEKVSPETRHLVASGLVGVFKKLWSDSWGPRLEYLLRNAILALLECPDATLLGINRLFIDKDYRKKVVDQVTDPVIKSFFLDEFSKYQDRFLQEAIAPIQNKVGQFLSSALIRNIVGQVNSSFSMREVMDQGKILIMNLSKGAIGEDNSNLMGGLMITRLQLAAMSRVDIPEYQRKDFYLYVDEFQNFATESFANILSEARKYRLSLILANQYVAQLEEKVRDAVFGNVGTMVSFRIGGLDAEFLEKEFEPTFTAIDIVNLEKYRVYLKMMIDGVTSNPFSATTLAPIELESTESNTQEVIDYTRSHYGSTKEKVEAEIREWSGTNDPFVAEKISQLAGDRIVESEDDVGGGKAGLNLAKKDRSNEKLVDDSKGKNISENQEGSPSESKIKLTANNPGDSGKAGREPHRADCSGCGTVVEVPFKPDGVRPVFCKDCLKNYQRERAKLEGGQKESSDQSGASSSKRKGKKKK